MTCVAIIIKDYQNSTAIANTIQQLTASQAVIVPATFRRGPWQSEARTDLSGSYVGRMQGVVTLS